MNYLQATILGIVEGLTEFLPVSSTGHLILTNALLGLDDRAADVFTIVIQLGAILAVLALYRNRVAEMIAGLLGKKPAGLSLFLKLLTAFFPAVILGLLFEEMIERLLFSPIPVASALVIGGVAMICVEKMYVNRDESKPTKSIEEMSYIDALFIGFVQCLALWPGTSRAMVTIVGAQLRGFSSAAAAEFSFLLALPTLGGATIYKLLKDRELFLNMDGGMTLVLYGNVVAFIVAYFAVKWFVGVVKAYGMTPFGIYRIVIGSVFLGLALAGVISF